MTTVTHSPKAPKAAKAPKAPKAPNAPQAARAPRPPAAAPPSPAAKPRSSLVPVVEAYLDELRVGRRLSPRTLDAYARDLGDYSAFAAARGLTRWNEASLTFVDAYFAAARESVR